jgi:organic radical activating enzyme
MKMFSTIAIEINSWCNRKCSFCPNAYHDRPHEFMNYDLLTSIFEQLKEYKGRVELYMYNEPFLHPNLCKIISSCRKYSSKSKIMIATNGDFLNKYNINLLFYSGLTQLQINVYEETMLNKITGVTKTLPKNIVEGNIYGHSKKLVYSIEKKWKTINNKLGRFELSNRSGLIPFPKTVLPIKSTCVRPFRSLQINWKGEAVLCCNDYLAKVVVGNAAKESLLEIWNGEKLQSYRKKLQDKDRDMFLCSTCSFKGGAYKHLLEKVK